MSFAANPNKPKKLGPAETAEQAAAKQLKAERERIRRLVITLGDDSTKKVSGQIRGLAGALEDDFDLHAELVSDTVVECARNLPMKTGIHAGLVTRMGEKHESWVLSVVERCLEDVRGALRTGRVSAAQLLLRFIVGLGNCGLLGVGSAGVLGLLQEVMSLSDGLKASKGGDLGIFLALASLPFMSPAAFNLVPELVDALLAKADGLLGASRQAGWKQLLRPLGGDFIAIDRLEALHAALHFMRKAQWSSQAVLHVPGFQPSLDGKLKLPSLCMTAEDVAKSKIRFVVPLVPLQLASKQVDAAPEEDALLAHDRWLLEDHFILTMEMFGADVEECCKQLLRIPMQHPSFEGVLVDVAFSLMLRLPYPTMLPLFYSRLLEGLVDKQPTLKKELERVFAALFLRASDLDEECMEVLAEAFAYHLSRNSYEADWSPFIGDAVSLQSQRFCRRSLERLQRLSFHQNLLHRLPEAVHIYIPPEPTVATGLSVQAKPEFARMLKLAKIKEPDAEMMFNFCRRLMKLEPATKQEPPTEGGGAEPEASGVEAKEESASKRRRLDEAGASSKEPDSVGETDASRSADVKQVKDEVEENVRASAAKREDNEEEADLLGEPPEQAWLLQDVAELLATALMQNGSKTPTHMSKMLDGYEKVLLRLRPSDDDEAHQYYKVLARSIFDFWRLSGQRLEITLESLLDRGVLSNRALVEVALEDCARVGESLSIWNLVNSVARKSLERMRSAQEEFVIAKRLEKIDIAEQCRKRVDEALHETADLFAVIFSNLARNHQEMEDKDQALRHVMLQRILAVGRKYHAFIKPLIKVAESKIPGVAHDPDIAAAFQSLRQL